MTPDDIIFWFGISSFLLNMIFLPLIFKGAIIPKIEREIGDIYRYVEPIEIALMAVSPLRGYLKKTFKITFHTVRLYVGWIFTKNPSAGFVKHCALCKAGLTFDKIDTLTLTLSIIQFFSVIAFFVCGIMYCISGYLG